MPPHLLLLVTLLVCCDALLARASKTASPSSILLSATTSGSSNRVGYHLARTPSLNKGSSFSIEERKALGVRGLFPAGEPLSLEVKVAVALEQLNFKSSTLEKYIFLHTLQDSDETLYYALLCRHTSLIMPFVYTPTVGEACQKWAQIFRHTPRGLYLSSGDAGHVRDILDNWPSDDIKVIVVTDGERILGLGDLGVNGMGIPIGKLALYTACAGIHPSQSLPVHIDVGTNNKALREDPAYMGLRKDRDRSPAYDALISEFFAAAQDKYGRNVLIQFEDFGNSNAFRLLDAFQPKACCFNDDIQGTASVVLAGILSSLSLAGKTSIAEHTFLFNGAGEAGVGIAQMITKAISKARQCPLPEAARQVWLVDSKGLVTSDRGDANEMAKAAPHKLAFAHPSPVGFSPPLPGAKDTLLSAIRATRPTALIGVSAQPGSFSPAVLAEMRALSTRPLVFALSNPTSKAECSAQEAYEHTDGACIFASGSPFGPVTLADGRHFTPGQGNNGFIFPGVGLGALAAGASTLTDDDFEVAAAVLAGLVLPERLAQVRRTTCPTLLSLPPLLSFCVSPLLISSCLPMYLMGQHARHFNLVPSSPPLCDSSSPQSPNSPPTLLHPFPLLPFPLHPPFPPISTVRRAPCTRPSTRSARRARSSPRQWPGTFSARGEARGRPRRISWGTAGPSCTSLATRLPGRSLCK